MVWIDTTVRWMDSISGTLVKDVFGAVPVSALHGLLNAPVLRWMDDYDIVYVTVHG